MTVSVLAPLIREDLGLSNSEYARIATWFLIAYTASHGLSGRLYDRIGTKRGFSFSITLWSFAAMAHAFARSAASLSLCRFLLGLGEAGNWPGAAKVIASWFPVNLRALAMGIFNSGAALGSAFAPILIVWLQSRFGWQATFLATGSLGFLWLALWLAVYREPDGQVSQVRTSQPWLPLLRDRRVWGIVLARMLTDPSWWLYLNWMPLYLNNARGLSLAQIGMSAWFPFVMADIGSLGGGWASGFLISRGWSPMSARRAIILGGATMMTASLMVARAGSPWTALLWISVVTFGFQAWVNNVQTLPSDLFPQSYVGSVAGLGGVGAGIGTILSTLAIGWIVDRFSYTPVLVGFSILPPIGTAILLLLTFGTLPIKRETTGTVPH
jgi:ACS family hexuronate transporter-like MFS transporter